jgi:hypothetical protein
MGGNAMTDIGIPSDVVAQIKMHLGSRARNLFLSQRDGDLVLSGTVSSYYVKQLVQHLALRLLNSTPFVNEIQVVAPDSGDPNGQLDSHQSGPSASETGDLS